MTDWLNWFQASVSEHGDSVEASHYDSARSFYTQQRAVLNWIGEVRSKKILDLGPGTGHFSHSLTAHNTVIGLDFVPQMLHFCAEKGLLPVQANGMTLPLADNSMDIIICAGVLQHIDEYLTFLKELLRVRKPDGQIYLTTLNQDSLARQLYYRLTANVQTMHTYQIPKLTRLIHLIEPNLSIESTVIYYPLFGFRRANTYRDRLLSTAFTLRIS